MKSEFWKHSIQLVETNFQLITRVFVDSKNNEIEKDKQLLKHQYRLYRNYLINTALLEIIHF